MGHAVTVNVVNFEEEVVEASQHKPVLVDFFATWCGPCQMLKPMLERLVQEYDFVLAAVDIDQNPDLANAYKVEGVPDVRVVYKGEMKPGFVGVLPEQQIRAMLASYGLQSDLERGVAELRQTLASGDLEAAKTQFRALIERYPNDQALRIQAARFWYDQNDLDEAERLMAGISTSERVHAAQINGLNGMIQFKRIVQSVSPETELDQVFVEASQAAINQDFETALMLFLEVVSRDRQYRNDAAREAMLTLFDVLSADHPLTRHYRKLLMNTMY